MIKYNYGCMMGGKTAYLINCYDIYSRKGMKPVIIKPMTDDRDGLFKGWGVTHSRLMPDKEVPAYYYQDIKKELPQLDFKSIIVDEAQFMTPEDVKYLIKVADERKIPVTAYGLRTDVNGNMFEGAGAWMALADEINEIASLCQIEGCNNKAVAHVRYVNGERDTSGRAVATEKGNVTYKSVCRKHWRGDDR